MEHDQADIDTKVACPTLVCWGANGVMQKQFDIAAEWRKRCADVHTASLPGGHFFIREQRAAVLAAIHDDLAWWLD